MAKYLGLDKVMFILRAIKENNGLKGFYLRLYRTDDVKLGTLMGTDKSGNKYYENNRYFYGRNRWVIYADKYGMDYDGSQVAPEWFGWLHYKTDTLPQEDSTRPHHKWMSDPDENFTGTNKQYVPYSTTRPKIEAWVPPSKK